MLKLPFGKIRPLMVERLYNSLKKYQEKKAKEKPQKELPPAKK